MGGMDEPQPPTITSRHNPRLKQAAALRDSRERRRTGRLLVDGARETLRALQAGVTPVEAFVDPNDDCPRTQRAVEALERRGAPIVAVASAALEKLAYGQRADGLVMLAEAPPRDLARLRLPSAPLVVVLVGIEKPGNLGAIFRTADGAGADAVIVADARVDLDNPNAIRASVGAVFRAGVAVATGAAARAWLAERGVPTVATRPDGAVRYTEADLAGPVALVFGSEAQGLPEAWADGATAISLPMLGVADSLNVSAAAAAVLYEARRQRDAAPR